MSSLWNVLLSVRRLFWFCFCSTAVVAIVFAIYWLPSALDWQGESNSSCLASRLAPVSNGQGMTISGHITLCDDFFHYEEVYIYLHKADEPESRRSLIFRYIAKPLKPFPKVQWSGSGSAIISAEYIVQATKIVTSHDGFSIHYDIEHAEFPNRLWQNSPLTWCGAYFILGGLSGLFFYLAKRALWGLIRGLREKAVM